MRFLERLSDKYFNKDSENANPEVLNRIFVVQLTSFFFTIACLFFGIIAFYYHLFPKAVLLFFACIGGLVSYYINRKRKNYKLARVFITILFFAILVFIMLTGESGDIDYIWIYAFPIGVIIMYGNRTGGILSVIFFAFLVLFLLAHNSFNIPAKYDFHFSVRLLSSYIILHLFIYILEFERIYNYKRQERNILESKSETRKKDDFISKLSHQIRTPLNNLTMVSNLLDRSKLDAEQLDLFDTIIASTNNLINVVENIVRVSSIKVDKEILSKTSFDLYSTIENTLKLFRDQYKDSLIINLDVSSKIKCNVIGDPIRDRKSVV